MKNLLKNIILLSTSVICLHIANISVAQTSPKFANFDGTNALSFPAEDSLLLSEIATIEFWVQPKWTSALDVAPAILSAIGPQGPRYAVVMTGKMEAIGLVSGDSWDYAEFDFGDGKPHHVALVARGELTEVYIDGVAQDTLVVSIQDLPVTSFHMGSLNGFDNLFVGQIAGLRLWNAALDEESIEQYRKTYIMDKAAFSHPDYEFLVGASDFQKDQRSFTLMSNDDDLETLADLLIDENQAEPEIEYDAGFLASLEAVADIELAAQPDIPEDDKMLEDNYDLLDGLDDEIQRLEKTGELTAIIEADEQQQSEIKGASK